GWGVGGGGGCGGVQGAPGGGGIAGREGGAMPFPNEETTPPVTNTNLGMGDKFRKSAFYRTARVQTIGHAARPESAREGVSGAERDAPTVERAFSRGREARAPRRSPASRACRRPAHASPSSPVRA